VVESKAGAIYKYAFESIAGTLKMVAWAGGVASAGFLLYHSPFSEQTKGEIVEWTTMIILLIFSFMMTRCRVLELTARRLNGFDKFRVAVPPEIVKQAEEDPQLK